MSCPKCHGSGLIPFVKEDKIIPHAFLNCPECHQDEPEQYYPVRPEDIDYPVSFSHYRALCQYHGWQDPGTDKPLERGASAPLLDKPEPTQAPAPWAQEQWLYVQQLHAQVNYLRNKLNTYTDSKATAKPQVGYKGIK